MDSKPGESVASSVARHTYASGLRENSEAGASGLGNPSSPSSLTRTAHFCLCLAACCPHCGGDTLHPACLGEDSGPRRASDPDSALQPSPSWPPRRGLGLLLRPFSSNVCLCGSGGLWPFWEGHAPCHVGLELGLGLALFTVSGSTLCHFGGMQFQEVVHSYSVPLHLC